MATPHPQVDKTGPAVPVSPPPPSEARKGGGEALGDPGPGMAFTEKGGGGFTSYLGAVRRAVDSISPTYTSTPEERNRCVETLLRTTIESEYVTKVALSALPCADNGSRPPPESRGYHLTPSNLSSILCRGKEARNEREKRRTQRLVRFLVVVSACHPRQESTALSVCERYLTQDPDRDQQQPSSK